MEGASASNSGADMELVFSDFRARRHGLIKALTEDFDEFYRRCDPSKRGDSEEEEFLCLYGYPDGQWMVEPPMEDVPTDLPEPVLGINLARDMMPKEEWLSWVAAHSDTWLLSVAFFIGARFGFRQAQRQQLHDMIEELPTVSEVVVAEINKKRQQQRKRKRTSSSASMQESYNERGRSKNMETETSKEMMKAEEEDEIKVEWVRCWRCHRHFHRQCVRDFSAKPRIDINNFLCTICHLPYDTLCRVPYK
ncbi:PHD finger protein ALFIN-LIKE 4-like [Neltuma alba]|uniref:PHD finger protein ALFIN-LIKE 4-like n=1 Tax=Neltuma alba TaxID=207710 RepID=UPI0010A58AC4|nr:PHD finger protein ALFIN-LIKE 4-like [Prosopis alba]XP_028777357.1 PHD finger protein ALFIN-LIKE 4-like [Prosopis alba]